METNHGGVPFRPHRVRVLGVVIGAGAVAAMAGFALAQPDSGPSGLGIPLAGSGDAPGNTTYSQPAIGQMKIGNTATVTTSAASPAG
ncbi:hypothetical protein [Mycolicibacterium brisbanense]|uniref:Uncharacterized protein n=1 Tax=Mycolicibacterium brisbanense TaxID=146020 RepID=A0A100W134_9MYCO|nr:hypothetical protein [Mycolicibacterium brisbanense]MCV7160124.1 hypothetical protein [Mycolicibacterium brisbanense]GAS89694.1 putative uncharacterized protein [Mycolicibacterium brisbanense]